MCRERERNKRIDRVRQIYRQTDRQAGSQVGGQLDRQIGRWIDVCRKAMSQLGVFRLRDSRLLA